jgi:hypothetical protein
MQPSIVNCCSTAASSSGVEGTQQAKYTAVAALAAGTAPAPLALHSQQQLQATVPHSHTISCMLVRVHQHRNCCSTGAPCSGCSRHPAQLIAQQQLLPLQALQLQAPISQSYPTTPTAADTCTTAEMPMPSLQLRATHPIACGCCHAAWPAKDLPEDGCHQHR